MGENRLEHRNTVRAAAAFSWSRYPLGVIPLSGGSTETRLFPQGEVQRLPGQGSQVTRSVQTSTWTIALVLRAWMLADAPAILGIFKQKMEGRTGQRAGHSPDLLQGMLLELPLKLPFASYWPEYSQFSCKEGQEADCHVSLLLWGMVGVAIGEGKPTVTPIMWDLRLQWRQHWMN